MNEAMTEALAEAYASADTRIKVFETIEISHASLPEPLYFVQDRRPLVATLETSEEVTFLPLWFNFTLPSAGENGRQDLSLSIDNINRVVSDFIAEAKNYTTPVAIVYRPYLSTDLSTPQLNPPLRLTLSDVNIGMLEVIGKATFADVVNQKFPKQYYTRDRFPSLGG